METITAQDEKLLIFENLQDQQRIRSEIENRCSILNQLTQAGLTNDEIKTVPQSLTAIDNYILERHLSENKKLRELHLAGIKAEATLPPALANLSYHLKAWHNYPTQRRGSDNFENLIYTNVWKPDEQALENLFIRTRLKFYIQGDDIAEFKRLDLIREYLEQARCPNNHIANSSFFNDRFESIGQFKFRIRWTFFSRERN